MYRSYPEKTAYTAYIENLKKENWDELTGANGPKGYRKATGLIRERRFKTLWKLSGKKLRRTFKRQKEQRSAQTGGLRQEKGRVGETCASGEPGTPPDYFSDEKIAVYTVIFGTYDVLREPKCRPDNCDYYLISDRVRPPEGSAWKSMELPAKMRERIAGSGSVQRNRFFKMLPHLLFPEYNYSVYLDGNIQLVTDPTEFINRMPAYGASFHRHVSRDCVFEEAKAILEQKKAPEDVMQELMDFLTEEQMPAHYGLLECPVIVRQHHSPVCIELMEAWWELFERFPYRDQMLLPYILYRRGIRPEELARLGDNVRKSPCFRRYPHLES